MKPGEFVAGSDQRTCMSCGLTFPATTEFFYRKTRERLESRCKECRKQEFREYNKRRFEGERGDDARAYHREWYAAHHGERIESYRRYAECNHEAILARRRQWLKDHPYTAREPSQMRRARIAQAEGSHTAGDIRLQYEQQHGRCYYCHHKLTDGYHIDHVFPLALGGSNWASNIVIACPSCNLQKHAQHPMDFCGRML